MYVCVCNAFTDRQVRACAAAAEGASVAQVYKCFGCAPRCGKCVPVVRAILEDLRRESDPPGLADSSAA